jgi:hypothetical protein
MLMKEKDQQKWMNLAWILKGVKADAEAEERRMKT